MATESICKGMHTIQRELSYGQAIPIIGPAVISPIKAVISLIQGVVAGILHCLGKVFDKSFNKSYQSEFTRLSKCLGYHAIINLGYSVLNITTLGIAGLAFELYNYSRRCQYQNSAAYVYCQAFKN